MRGRYTDPWQTLYFRPDPRGHGSFRPGLADPGMVDTTDRCVIQVRTNVGHLRAGQAPISFGG
jgi:hypothetical protein